MACVHCLCVGFNHHRNGLLSGLDHASCLTFTAWRFGSCEYPLPSLPRLADGSRDSFLVVSIWSRHGTSDTRFRKGTYWVIHVIIDIHELTSCFTRLAAFFLTASLLSAFANILAYGIIQIANVNHTYKGWRWIYIIEGALTCALALLSWFIIVDFPDSARNKFLSSEEKSLIRSRLQEDRGDYEGQKVTPKIILQTALDWKVWAL